MDWPRVRWPSRGAAADFLLLLLAEVTVTVPRQRSLLSNLRRCTRTQREKEREERRGREERTHARIQG